MSNVIKVNLRKRSGVRCPMALSSQDERRSVTAKGENLPFISVIMPIRNEEDFIESSLSAILNQDYPHDKMEVLIADGMSTDRTRDVISHLVANQNIIPVIILDNPGRIVPTAMNIAIRRAKGEIIVRVDGHAVIQKDYVRQCVEWLIKNEVDCVGGVVESVGSGYVGEAIAAAMSSPFGVGGSGFRTASDAAGPVLTDTVPFGAYRKEVFDRIGLFNEQMVRHQDYEFCYRLRKDGGKIILLPAARAKYFVRSTLSSLWKQYWQYGIWKGRFLRAHPDSIKLRHLIPPLFVFMMIVSSVLGIVSEVGVAVSGLTLGAYGLFIIGALISVSRTGNVKYVPVLPIIFGSLHVSWGMGLWLGLSSRKLSLERQENGKE